MDPYFNLFNIERRQDGYVLSGKLRPGSYPIPGNVSSQFITGLMFALPLLDDDSEITVESPLESKPYIDLTLHVLKTFGINIISALDGYYIPGKQKYRPCVYTVEGDESAAAFWRVANALGSDITCKGLNPDSLQGDRVICDIIKNDARDIDVR